MPEKIMFVDDELTKTPTMLEDIFDSILAPTEKTDLKNLESSPMGADIEDIKEALKDNPFLEVFDSLEDALVRISKSGKDILSEFELFVFDRNLGSSAGGGGGYISYDINRINEISDIKFTKDYSERGVEGDFLAEVLLALTNEDALFPRLYFYSAYADKKTQISAKLKNRHEEDHCIDKLKPEKMREIIERRKLISACVPYRDEIRFLGPIIEGIQLRTQKSKNHKVDNLKDKFWSFFAVTEEAAQSHELKAGNFRSLIQELILELYNHHKSCFDTSIPCHCFDNKAKKKISISLEDAIAKGKVREVDIHDLIAAMQKKQGKFEDWPNGVPKYIVGLFHNVNNGLSDDSHNAGVFPKYTIMVFKYSLLRIIEWLNSVI